MKADSKKDEPIAPSVSPTAAHFPVPAAQGRLLMAFGTVMTALGLAIYAMDSDLINFFLPTRWVVPGLAGLGLALLGLRQLRSDHPAGSKFTFGVAAMALILIVVVYAREFNSYREIPISFENRDATLSGTLYLPNEVGPHSAVVIAHGSIRAPRRLYHFWADRLVRQGIAVYSFDKRGTGESTGHYEAENNARLENLDLLASDVAGAISEIRRHPEIAGSRVGILGLSMGGWLGPLAVAHTDSVDFMVLVSGPTVSVGEEGYFSDLTGEMHGDGSGLPQAAIDSLVAAREPSHFDPRPLLRTMSVPSLWLFAADDSSIPVAKSKVVLDSLVNQYGRPMEYVIYPDAEHLGFVMKWPYDLAPGLMDELTDWTIRQAGS